MNPDHAKAERDAGIEPNHERAAEYARDQILDAYYYSDAANLARAYLDLSERNEALEAQLDACRNGLAKIDARLDELLGVTSDGTPVFGPRTVLADGERKETG